MPEKWKHIEGYEGRYMISNLGRVKSLAREFSFGFEWKIKRSVAEIIMHQFPHWRGYQHVYLSKPGNRRKKFFIHRLVACAFIPNPQNKEIVNHKDGNKKNNILLNLEWMTGSENTQHYYDEIRRSNLEFDGQVAQK